MAQNLNKISKKIFQHKDINMENTVLNTRMRIGMDMMTENNMMPRNANKDLFGLSKVATTNSMDDPQAKSIVDSSLGTMFREAGLVVEKEPSKKNIHVKQEQVGEPEDAVVEPVAVGSLHDLVDSFTKTVGKEPNRPAMEEVKDADYADKIISEEIIDKVIEDSENNSIDNVADKEAKTQSVEEDIVERLVEMEDDTCTCADISLEEAALDETGETDAGNIKAEENEPDKYSEIERIIKVEIKTENIEENEPDICPRIQEQAALDETGETDAGNINTDKYFEVEGIIKVEIKTEDIEENELDISPRIQEQVALDETCETDAGNINSDEYFEVEGIIKVEIKTENIEENELDICPRIQEQAALDETGETDAGNINTDEYFEVEGIIKVEIKTENIEENEPEICPRIQKESKRKIKEEIIVDKKQKEKSLQYKKFCKDMSTQTPPLRYTTLDLA